MAFEPPVCDECGHEGENRHYFDCSILNCQDCGLLRHDCPRHRAVPTIDLTPDSDGYAAIGATLVSSLYSDFKEARRKDAAFILSNVIDIAYGFGYAAGRTGSDDFSDGRGLVLREKLFDRIGGRPK